MPELIETDAVEDFAILGYAALFDIARGVGRRFDLRLDDEAAADEIDDVADFGVTPNGKFGAGEVAESAVNGLVVVEVVAGEMEDSAVFQFEEVMRAGLAELADAEGAIDAKVGIDEEFLRFEFIGEVVDHCLTGHSRIVEHDGHDDDEHAQVGEDDDGKHADSGVAEGNEGRHRGRGKSDVNDKAKQ